MKKFEFVIERTQVNALVIEAEDIDLADELARYQMEEMDWSEQDSDFKIIDVTEAGNSEWQINTY